MRIGLLLGWSAAGLMVCGCAPSFLASPDPGRVTVCKRNLNNLAAACYLYAQDWEGEFPESLEVLVRPGKRRYLDKLPRCPAAAADSYSASYRRFRHRNRPAFELCCQGWHHRPAGLPQDRPAYSSISNLKLD